MNSWMPRLNWFLLVTNLLILGLLTFGWVFPVADAIRKGFALEDASRMETYVARRPFAVLTDPAFPGNRAYRFLDMGCLLSLDVSPVEHGSSLREAWLRIGDTFSVSCTFSSNAPTTVREYCLTRGPLTVMDLNADGSYDLRVSQKPDLRSEIWADGKWQGVVIGGNTGKYLKEMRDGTWRSFDMDAGRWVEGLSSNRPTGHDGDLGGSVP